MAHTEFSGVRIVYDGLGHGTPALLFLGCWWVNRTVFEVLAPRCAERRRCLALDWRGHGESEQLEHDFGAAELVKDALAVIEASAAEQVVPVALAHSGWRAIELWRIWSSRAEDRTVGLADHR